MVHGGNECDEEDGRDGGVEESQDVHRARDEAFDVMRVARQRGRGRERGGEEEVEDAERRVVDVAAVV